MPKRGSRSKADRFTQIKTSFLRDPTISPGAKVVGLIFASYADRDGIAFPGVRRLMEESGMGRDAVKRGRAQLVKLGLLKKCLRRNAEGRLSKWLYYVDPTILANASRKETVTDQSESFPQRTESQSSGPDEDISSGSNSLDEQLQEVKSETLDRNQRTENPASGIPSEWQNLPQGNQSPVVIPRGSNTHSSVKSTEELEPPLPSSPPKGEKRSASLQNAPLIDGDSGEESISQSAQAAESESSRVGRCSYLEGDEWLTCPRFLYQS